MNTTATKKNGELIFLKPWEIERYIAKYKEDERFDVDFKLHRERISDRQRGYYFAAIITPAAKHFNVDYNDMHIYFKSLFLLTLKEFKGEVVPKIPSIMKLSTKEMANYTEHVRVELRSPDNIFKESYDTEDPEDYFLRKEEEGIL